MSDFCIVSTTVDSDYSVRKIIENVLIQEQLAASVQTIPVNSHYMWRGCYKQKSEIQMIFKTTSDKYGMLKERITELHPYEVPEILSFGIKDGSSIYLNGLGEKYDASIN